MDFRKKPSSRIIASGFVFLMLLALLATGASAADQLRIHDQLQDQDKDQLQDGSCKLEAGISLCDRDQDRLKDGSCQVSGAVSNCNGGCDRDRLRDGSCLTE